MKSIRSGVFETNSSSSHSITISPAIDGLYDTITPDSNGIITLQGGRFGWEWERYIDAETKANYAGIYALNYSKTDQLIEVIKEHTGAKEVRLNFSTDWSGSHHSYIDHQSSDTAAKAFTSNQTLKDFLFSPKSVLFTGNDNDAAMPNFYDEPETVYGYELSVFGVKPVQKFVKKPTDKELKEGISSLMAFEPLARDYGKNRFSFHTKLWPLMTITGEKFDSLAKFKENKIILYKTKIIYSGGNDTKYVGEEILDQKEISFILTKLKKAKG